MIAQLALVVAVQGSPGAADAVLASPIRLPLPASTARAPVMPTSALPASAAPTSGMWAWTRTWLGADKVKHFFVAAFVQSTAYSAIRWSGASRATSHAGAGIATAAAGVLKEVRDRRAGGSFSVPDLAWGLAGAAAAAALLNHTR